ncbi:hypothetical protein GLW36_03100 [Halorubrum terrestre]|uniref:Uncharacterized protein n=1 Tax=Halorubrum distributum TaxID=29283 RepID=A0A6B1IBT4_9EURY|nr:hypothetical protein [Halorubrum terrestre]MYL15636.1 hypothetical protein [Halorubrum terrestre]
MSATSNDEAPARDATSAEEAVDRHGEVYRQWADEDSRRGRVARSILRAGSDDWEGDDDAE